MYKKRLCIISCVNVCYVVFLKTLNYLRYFNICFMILLHTHSFRGYFYLLAYSSSGNQFSEGVSPRSCIAPMHSLLNLLVNFI